MSKMTPVTFARAAGVIARAANRSARRPEPPPDAGRAARLDAAGRTETVWGVLVRYRDGSTGTVRVRHRNPRTARVLAETRFGVAAVLGVRGARGRFVA